MYRYLCVVIIGCLCFQAAQASAGSGLDKKALILKEGHLVVKPSVLADASDCQPKQGDLVKEIALVHDINGIRGLNAVQVRILAGSCEGKHGWIAQSLLQPGSASVLTQAERDRLPASGAVDGE